MTRRIEEQVRQNRKGVKLRMEYIPYKNKVERATERGKKRKKKGRRPGLQQVIQQVLFQIGVKRCERKRKKLVIVNILC